MTTAEQWRMVDAARVAEVMQTVRDACTAYLGLLASGRVDTAADAAMRALLGVNVHRMAEHEATQYESLAAQVVSAVAAAPPRLVGAPLVSSARDLSEPGALCYRPGATSAAASWLEFDKDAGDELRLLLDGELRSFEASEVMLTQQPVVDPTGGGWLVTCERIQRRGFDSAQPADGARWQVVARRWDTPDADDVTPADGHAINPRAVATADGRLHVVYQQVTDAGQFEIVYRERGGSGGWSTPITVSSQDRSCWDPGVSTDGENVAVVWSAVEDGRFRLTLRRLVAGAWESAVAVPMEADGHALHPDITHGPDGAVWIAADVVHADNLATSGRTALVPTAELNGQASFQPLPSYSLDTRLTVVRYGGRSWQQPVGELVSEPSEGGYPRLTFDQSGRLWLGYRTMRQLPFRSYLALVALRIHDGDRWSPPALVPGSEAGNAEFALVADDAGMAVVHHGDDYPERFLEMLHQDPLATVEPPIAEGTVRREHLALPKMGRIATGSHRGGGTIRRSSATVSAPECSPGLRPVSDGQQRGRASRADPKGWPPSEDVELLWGDMHRHSNISRCGAGLDIGTADHYRFAEDLMGYDFWLLTDHAEGTSDLSWHQIRAQANATYRPRRHVTLLGYEWTSFAEGHQNVVFAGDDGPMLSSADDETAKPDGLWQALGDVPALTIPHHPSSLCYFTNWSWKHDRLRLVELFQAATGSYEDDWCARQYHDAVIADSTAVAGLRAGQRVGFVASTDHRAGSAYVGVYSSGRDRESVHRALWDRRCFAATRRGIVPLLRIGPADQGQQVPFEGAGRIEFGGTGVGELAVVQLIRDGAVVADSRPADGQRHHLDVRISTQQGGPRELSGSLRVVDGGASLVVPEYCAPIIAGFDEREIRWQATLPERYAGHPLAPGAFTFSVSVDGRSESELELVIGELSSRVSLADLNDGPVRLSLAGAELAVRRGLGSLTGLGTQTWTGVADPTLLRSGSWYYTRVFQTDGEMAWSSPVWVD